jgi:hypothetical protein
VISESERAEMVQKQQEVVAREVKKKLGNKHQSGTHIVNR